jgi:hypothetical protein
MFSFGIAKKKPFSYNIFHRKRVMTIYSSKNTGSLVLESQEYGKEYAGTNMESFTNIGRMSSPGFTFTSVFFIA